MSDRLEPMIEPERYELHEQDPAEMTRRQILKVLGGGILVLSGTASLLAQGQRRGGGAGAGAAPSTQQIGSWIHVGADGQITAFTGKVEVGQNARTMLCQAVAEELRVPMDRVKLVMGDTDLVPFDAGTFGSRTTPAMVPQLRRAAAAAREQLLTLAAARWSVPKASLKLGNATISANGNGQTASYGELAKEQPLDQRISGSVELTPLPEWKVLGKSELKVEGRAMVTGSHRYTTDLDRSNMLHAKVLRAPSFGAKLKDVDTSEAEKMPGVKVVRDGGFVAVAAPSLRQADAALKVLSDHWEETEQASRSELFSILRPGEAPSESADPASHRSRYTAQYIAHVPLEPRAALAEWDGKKMTVHTGTQRPFGVRGEVANALGLPESQVRVIVPDTGSGYGGKHTGDAAVEAARIAHKLGQPVRLVWTRQEEFTWAYFRPAGVVDVSSTVDQEGRLTSWQFDNTNSGGAGISTPYDVPQPQTQFHQARSPLRQGSYRALAATFNNFARESHMDELAHKLGRDSLEFRLANLKNERLRAVLLAAAEKFGWKDRPKGGSGTGYGIACGTEKGGYVATAVEVSVSSDQEVRVVRAVTAFECGAILNPAHLQSQVDGCVLMGLGGALFEEIDFAEGRILTDRLSRYRVPRFSDVPIMETVLLDRKDLPSAGAGEAPIVAIAPAIADAIFGATGKRLRSLPLKLK